VPSQRAVNRPADGINDRSASQEIVPTPPADVQKPAWLTAEEAAQYLKVKPRTVVLWARQGKLKGYPTPSTHRHRWRFLHADLDAMLTKPSVALPKRRDE
jgi:excisionase family DNA binding protein